MGGGAPTVSATDELIAWQVPPNCERCAIQRGEKICSLTASMVATLLTCIPRLRLSVFRREVDQLDEGASNVYGYVAHEVSLLMGQHDTGSVPPPLVCSRSKGPMLRQRLKLLKLPRDVD